MFTCLTAVRGGRVRRTSAVHLHQLPGPLPLRVRHKEGPTADDRLRVSATGLQGAPVPLAACPEAGLLHRLQRSRRTDQGQYCHQLLMATH